MLLIIDAIGKYIIDIVDDYISDRFVLCTI